MSSGTEIREGQMSGTREVHVRSQNWCRSLNKWGGDATRGKSRGITPEPLSGAPMLGATLAKLASLKVLASVVVRSESHTCLDDSYLPVQPKLASQKHQVRLVRCARRRTGPEGDPSYHQIVDYFDYAPTRGRGSCRFLLDAPDKLYGYLPRLFGQKYILTICLLVHLPAFPEQVVQNFHLNARKAGVALGGGRGDHYKKPDYTGSEFEVICRGTVHDLCEWQDIVTEDVQV
ncbi:uncharacterized protein LACBIDRAFT_322619 [Laccaria bicolor S238N-H82]|uniref:Predicted protein n=1 Tax=Laccaria bicolor (strain S238N-H82 / ATCC MYA-4686) TaxID=486041 RepID=B0CWY4_LACBS|nr:uncharacterized protein LACBIDRAFT_322619 [Laccaria bicolor S238N-H82]EDR13588.1 predicted protein [Laccaria bicolor S238N-H82]|eukprot:XP_001876086.1 predicted protein [Laccaria bicolor S238N-H82]